MVFGQAASKGTSGQSLKQFSQESKEKTQEQEGRIADFILSVIGGLLRHPDPKIRLQAVQSLIGGMASAESGGGGGKGTLTDIFSGERRSGTGEGTTGAGPSIFVPDLYTMLADSDPEVRDMASVGLDVLFGTDVTLLRMMEDPDPLIRKYATKVFAKKTLTLASSRGGSRGAERQQEQAYELLALRTLLVRLRYEKDEDIRKALTDALDWYILFGGGEGGRTEEGTMFGSEATILGYLKDENPDVRKNAIKIGAEMEFSQTIFNTFLNMLKTETDPEVKAVLQDAIDYMIEKQAEMAESGGRRGGRAGGGFVKSKSTGGGGGIQVP